MQEFFAEVLLIVTGYSLAIAFFYSAVKVFKNKVKQIKRSEGAKEGWKTRREVKTYFRVTSVPKPKREITVNLCGEVSKVWL